MFLLIINTLFILFRANPALVREAVIYVLAEFVR